MSNNNNLSNLPIKDRDKFLKELQALLNKYNIECREIIIKNIYTYISNLEDKSLILTQKDTESILEGILIIPLKLYIQDDNLWLEYYTKEEYEESNKDAEIYCDRMEDFSADEINATFIIIEKTENLNELWNTG